MSTGSVQAFKPVSMVALSASTTAQSAAISPRETALVFNSTLDVVFVLFGGLGTVATTANATPVPAGMRQLFQTSAYTNTVSVISNSAGAGTVFVTSGDGTQY